MKEEYKKKITKNEYYQLMGLVEIAHQAYLKIKICDEAMKEIIEYEDYFNDFSTGLLFDEYFEDTPNVKKCLKNMGIKIKL